MDAVQDITTPLITRPIRILISRKHAKKIGLKQYYTGKPCKHGHIAPRFVIKSTCLQCYDDRNRSFREDPIVKEHRRELCRVNRQNNRERVRQGARRRAPRYKEKNYARQRAWWVQNKDKCKQASERWNKKNPEIVSKIRRAKGARRRARLRQIEGTYSRNDIELILTRQKGLCTECRTKLGRSYHVDHIIPIARGGSNWPKNLQCLCPSCNSKKGAKDPIVWARENGRLL